MGIGGIDKRKRDLIKLTDMSERIASCGSLDNASLLLQYCNGKLRTDFPVNTSAARCYRNIINANDISIEHKNMSCYCQDNMTFCYCCLSQNRFIVYYIHFTVGYPKQSNASCMSCVL